MKQAPPPKLLNMGSMGTFQFLRLELGRERLKYFAKKFAITLGANGASIFDGDTFVDIEPYREALDTNGAGDMFAGAFLYGITHGHTYAEAG